METKHWLRTSKGNLISLEEVEAFWYVSTLEGHAIYAGMKSGRDFQIKACGPHKIDLEKLVDKVSESCGFYDVEELVEELKTE